MTTTPESSQTPGLELSAPHSSPLNEAISGPDSTPHTSHSALRTPRSALHTPHPLDLSHPRVLVIDDTAAIHDDFRKILAGAASPAMDDAEAALFGFTPATARRTCFILDSAQQGDQGLALVQQACAEGRPYAMAFVDVRMPPGWDGVETTARLWEADPDLQIVICTAYSDYSWDEMTDTLGASDNLLILKKPFDTVEVLQLAHALTKKWFLTQQSKTRLQDLDRLVNERTRELRASNENLETQIAERIRTEEELRAAQARLSHLVTQSPSVIYSLKPNGNNVTCTWVSQNVLQMIGYSADDARQPEWWSTLVHPGDWDQTAAAREQLASTGKSALEYRVRHRNGHYRWVRDEQRLVRTADGHPLEVIGTWMDITERKELEERFRQAQKMEAVGQLAGGVAHDFNNLLLVMRGHAELLMMRPEHHTPQTRDSLKQITAAAERAANLTRQLLAFSRKQVLQSQPLLLSDVVANLTRMLQRIIGENIQLQCHYASQLPHVEADAGMLEQVLVNLVVNSRDAMPGGGRLLITTEEVALDETQARANRDATPGRFVCLSVNDNGTGIAPENLPRIFEPFFTTKEVGKGTGLGLATVYGIIKQHHGWLDVSSQLGAGTTFRIFLPALDTQPAAAAKPEEDANLRGGTETILLVEDDQPVRSLTRRLLENSGYQVREAASGPEALAAWTTHAPQIQLLLTDIVMPQGMTGRALAEQLRAQRPALKVVFISGYTADITGRDLDFFRQPRTRFLQKPCPWRELLNTVRQCLDEP